MQDVGCRVWGAVKRGGVGMGFHVALGLAEPHGEQLGALDRDEVALALVGNRLIQGSRLMIWVWGSGFSRGDYGWCSGFKVSSCSGFKVYRFSLRLFRIQFVFMGLLVQLMAVQVHGLRVNLGQQRLPATRRAVEEHALGF